MIFYLVCGVSASLIWMITAWNSPFPAVGASGAIAGVLGAYFTFFPRAQVRTLIGFGFFFRIIRIRAYTLIGLWALYQFLLAIVPINTGVAFWAHVGGFIVGLILAKTIGPDPRRVQFYSP
jgi:membrane associated rhomboid family serine protease